MQNKTEFFQNKGNEEKANVRLKHVRLNLQVPYCKDIYCQSYVIILIMLRAMCFTHLIPDGICYPFHWYFLIDWFLQLNSVGTFLAL